MTNPEVPATGFVVPRPARTSLKICNTAAEERFPFSASDSQETASSLSDKFKLSSTACNIFGPPVWQTHCEISSRFRP